MEDAMRAGQQEEQGRKERGGDGSERQLERSSPFRESGLGGHRLGQILDELFGPSWISGPSRGAWPAVDVDEDDDAYHVCLEVPGVRREDIEVEIHGDMVTVRGEKRREESPRRSRWSERAYGAFVRSFSLPSDVESEQARASFRDGILTLTFPKREQAKPRRIEVQPEGSAPR
jgi:HSP20 family protein